MTVHQIEETVTLFATYLGAINTADELIRLIDYSKELRSG